MLKFVLPLFMVAASSAQTFFYPTTTASASSMYRYGGFSSYYPTYMPTAYYPTSTYIRSGYFYPYSRTHMTMTYPTFMARSDGGVYDAKPADFAKGHHGVRGVDAAPGVMAAGHHVPVTHVPAVPVTTGGAAGLHHPAAHPGHHGGAVAVAVPFSHFGYQPVSVAGAISAPKDMIPTIAAEPSTVAGHHHHTRHATAHPVAAAPATGPVAYAVPVPSAAGYAVPSAAGYAVPVAFDGVYGPSQFTAGARGEHAPVGMTGGASFVPAGAVPVDVKGTYEPAPVTADHQGKHFEGKKSGTF